MKAIMFTVAISTVLIIGCSESPKDEFLPEEVETSISLDRIYDGGPGKDGIPALTSPKTVSAVEGDKYLNDTDIVIGVTFDNISRAYPIRILNWHEIVNDKVGGMEVLVSYCPLCGTGIVFDPRVNGVVREFGVSGLLFNSDLLMYERGTEESSLWAQVLGEAVVGPLTGTKLTILPAVQTTWEEWKGRHPDTTVLDIDTGHSRNYGRNPYLGYDEQSGTYFPVEHKDDRLFSKTWIYGIDFGDAQKAYELEALKARGILNDAVGSVNLVLISHSRSGSVRAYERGGHMFSGSAAEVHDELNQTWKINEDALINTTTGERLERVQGVNSFWFGWVAFFPETALFE